MARILVIEDDEQVLSVLKEALEYAEHEVLTASDGEEGIKLFDPNRIDLVITDILMPGMEGLETIKLLRKTDPDVRIIAISGGGAISSDDYLAMALTFGAERTFSKPFHLDKLLEAVSDIVGMEEKQS